MKPTLLVREISSSGGISRNAMKGDGNDSNGVGVDRTKGFTKYHIRLTKTPGWYGVWDKNGKQKFEGNRKFVTKNLKKLKTRMGNVQLKSLIDVATKRKGKDITFDVVESVNEGFEKYHLGNLLDSKLKTRLERAIKLWGGKIDAVGMDTIKFRLSSSEVTKLPMLLKKLDQNKNVWIGDKRKNNIWDRKNNIDKLNERKLDTKIKKAILIAIEMSGNMTGAVKKIEKLKKGLSKDKKVKDALRLANESTNRDYKKEYKKYGSSTKAKKYRAELNQYNRKRGTYGNGDGKDASHRGGKIVGFESQSKNRGRAEKSRLKSEGKKALKHYDQIVGGIQQAIEGMRALQDKINDAPYNPKWGKITDMLYKKELDFQNMLRRSIPQVKNIAQDKVLEAKTQSIDGEELLKYLQKRFKMSRKQAIASMKKHNMDVSFLKEGINWKKFNSMVQNAIEYEYEWDYVESEGENGVRFDWSKGSMWVHPPADLLGDKIPASATGQIPPDKDVKKALKKLKINTRQIPSRTGYKK